MEAFSMMAALVACPLCGGIGARSSPGLALMVIMMAVIPYGIAALVVRAVRRSEG